MNNLLEYITIGIYLIFLLKIGMLFRSFNSNISDYIRGGAMGTWWMVGTSTFMAGMSAFTFTGNAGAAFNAGLSPIVLYLAGMMVGIVMYLGVAAWFRQTRAVTLQDIIRERFGAEVEQLNGYLAVILGPVGSSVQLWALAVFVGAVLGLPVVPMIICIGSVVVLYSFTGGRWAVMATDFFQSLILVPITIVVAVLCIVKIGGFGEFFSFFTEPAFAEDFKFINDEGHWPGDRFSPKWMVVIFISSVVSGVSLVMAPRYLSVKDGNEAKKSALLALILATVGMVIWLIPPMTARFLYESQVLAMPMAQPENSAYAVAAINVLPNGLVGILIVAMFAATMSSMDTGLNGISGAVVNNLVPPILRKLKVKQLSERNQLHACRVVTLCLGVFIVSSAVYLASMSEVELFDMFLLISSVIGMPIVLPFAVGLFVKKLPRWYYMWMFVACLVPSVWAWADNRFFGGDWQIDDRILWIMMVGLVATLVSIPFYKYSSVEYKTRVDKFFKKMKTPIDYAMEVGKDNTATQLLMMGKVSIAGGLFVSLLLLLPNAWSGRLAILFVSGFTFCIGCLMYRAGAVARGKKPPSNDS